MFFIRQPSCAKLALSKLRFKSVETLDEQKLSEKAKKSVFREEIQTNLPDNVMQPNFS